ncbi:MAG: hypothetical protein JXA46_12940 [Dehalococcoidales bacterium]|nr:hypothetical protein [Dehalococcoidales bacterium]
MEEREKDFHPSWCWLQARMGDSYENCYCGVSGWVACGCAGQTPQVAALILFRTVTGICSSVAQPAARLSFHPLG